MKTTVTELADSRVRVEVEVPAGELEKRLDRAARELAGEMKLPGFRKGKVPAQLVVQRLGRAPVVEQALRGALPEWYDEALRSSGVRPVGEPKLDVGELPAAGEDLLFQIEIGVRPPAKLGEYLGLEVGRPEPEVPDQAVEAELERLREGFASLSPVDRPAGEGDVVSLDYRGTVEGEPFEGGSGSDQLIELGSATLVEGFEEALVGASAGEEREIAVTFPDDYRAEELAGKAAKFDVTVNEVREKSLPALDDEFASDASEFETLADLRDEIRSRAGEAAERQAQEGFREAVVDAVVAGATIDVPDEIVTAQASESLDRFLHDLSHRGVDPEAFVNVQEGGREAMLESVKGDAERSLRREAALSAVAEAEAIEVSDEDLLEALGPGEGKNDPRKLLDKLRQSGRDELLREEIRMRRAADLVVEAAKPIPLERAAAREAIWTPETGGEKTAAQPGGSEGESAGKIWTPGR
ncbi:MAG: trigger factor [Solirubrobacterales bacterium]